MVALRIHREPINSDPAAEVPREQWGELLTARREFCERKLPHDCRLLLFFIEDGAANNWLGLGSREQYIRDGLKLQPKMVEWALKGLRATRPDVALKLKRAVYLGKRGAPTGNQNRVNALNKSRNTRIDSLGQSDTAAYVCGRLESEGRTELLAQVERGEISANAAAKEAGYRKLKVCHLPTVPGFLKAAQAHLSPQQRLELKEAL
jgi:hypothetical protein